MVRFSIKRLLASTAIIALGVAVFLFPIWLGCGVARKGGEPIGEALQVVIAFSGAAIVGAGFGNMLKRPVLGAILSALLLLTYGIIWNLADYLSHGS